MLGTPVDEPFMVALQNEILAQTNTQKHLSAQHPDGWFGHELHGIDGMDCHIGGLLNLGVEASYPAIRKAVTALLTPEIASTHKNLKQYETAIDFSTIVSTGTAIKIGVKCSSAKADYWTVFDDFRLLFYGEPQEDGTEDAIQDIPTAQPHSGNIYDLQGRRIVGKPSQGIYIQGGKKIKYTSK